jgi:rhamnulokinase
MPETSRHLVFDLGAESGRAILGSVEDDRLSLDVLHRFPNTPTNLLGHGHWDAPRLFGELKTGLSATIAKHGAQIDSLGVDTWGVDFGLLDRNNELLGLPYFYRDHRTDGMMEKVFDLVPRDEVYGQTGIQFMQINTLYQLMAMRVNGSPQLDAAERLLTMPDLLNFWLTGEKTNELSIASTTQCYNPAKRDWAFDLLERIGLPTRIFGAIIAPGATVGALHPSVQRETNAGAIPVIVPACHDTGSAVAAAPAESEHGWAYISCGTWSLVGVERPEPVINERTLKYNLTNEVGYGHSIRLLRNVMGLWLLQQCRRSWEHDGRSYEYEELAHMAKSATPFTVLVDPDDPRFLNPTDMPSAIADYCRATGQQPPEDASSTVRCIIESLALKYRWVIERLEEVTGERIETIHMIGGGCQNVILCQATADASGRRVMAGPVEGTAAGSAVIQAIACGRLGSLAEARALIRRSFPIAEYLPSEATGWDEAWERFERLISAS